MWVNLKPLARADLDCTAGQAAKRFAAKFPEHIRQTGPRSWVVNQDAWKRYVDGMTMAAIARNKKLRAEWVASQLLNI